MCLDGIKGIFVGAMPAGTHENGQIRCQSTQLRKHVPVHGRCVSDALFPIRKNRKMGTANVFCVELAVVGRGRIAGATLKNGDEKAETEPRFSDESVLCILETTCLRRTARLPTWTSRRLSHRNAPT